MSIAYNFSQVDRANSPEKFPMGKFKFWSVEISAVSGASPLHTWRQVTFSVKSLCNWDLTSMLLRCMWTGPKTTPKFLFISYFPGYIDLKGSLSIEPQYRILGCAREHADTFVWSKMPRKIRVNVCVLLMWNGNSHLFRVLNFKVYLQYGENVFNHKRRYWWWSPSFGKTWYVALTKKPRLHIKMR